VGLVLFSVIVPAFRLDAKPNILEETRMRTVGASPESRANLK
jgi:hypothetical protein